MTPEEALAIAFSFAEGLRDAEVSAEARATAFVAQLASLGFVVASLDAGAQARSARQGGSPLTGAELRAARGRLGLKRSALATLSGVDRGTIQRFEHGIRVPQACTVAKLRDAIARAGSAAQTAESSRSSAAPSAVASPTLATTRSVTTPASEA